MGLRLWLYLPSVGLQGAVNSAHPEVRVCFDFPGFFKRVFLTSGPVSQRPPPNRTDCRSQWRKFKSRRTVAAEIARITYENMLLGSAPCFAPSLFAFPCRIKTSTTYCSSHKSNCESTSPAHFISCLHGVCACLCWPGTSRGDQAGARGIGKGTEIKCPFPYSIPQGGEELEYLSIPDLARHPRAQNIILKFIFYIFKSFTF